jgi:guanylate kinase
MQRGELFILSAPSGSGKTTLIDALLRGGTGEIASAAARGEIAFSISHTTRAPRAGERDGVDYHFVDRPRFEAMAAAGRFLEWAPVHGHLYGTACEEVLPRLARGVDVVLDIDVQGAEIVMARHSEAHGIFILPPSYAVLVERLTRRGLDDGPAIARRLAVSLGEIERYVRYEYVIINDEARRAGEALAAIILEKRHRLSRMRERVAGVLADFQAAAGGPPEAADSVER